MASVDLHGHADYRHRRRSEQRQYWILLGICWLPFLAVASARRLASLAGLRRAAPDPQRSVFAEARDAASCISFAFR